MTSTTETLKQARAAVEKLNKLAQERIRLTEKVRLVQKQANAANQNQKKGAR